MNCKPGLHMRLPPLNTLAAFEATARLLNLSRAGEELHVTHAAISSQIKRLETWFGRKLFQRSGRGIVLTPAGEEFRKTVDVALVAISAASLCLRRDMDARSFRVACLPSVATRWLIPALTDFKLKHPAISAEVVYAKAGESFDPERCDVLITNLKTASKEVSATKLFTRTSKPVASPSYLAKNRHLMNGSLKHAVLLHDEVATAWNEWFATAKCVPESVKHGPVFADFNFLVTAAIAGHGVALCPIEVFRREIAAGDLVVLSDVMVFPDEGYYLVSDKIRTRAVTAFTRWFKAICDEGRS